MKTMLRNIFLLYIFSIFSGCAEMALLTPQKDETHKGTEIKPIDVTLFTNFEDLDNLENSNVKNNDKSNEVDVRNKSTNNNFENSYTKLVIKGVLFEKNSSIEPRQEIDPRRLEAFKKAFSRYFMGKKTDINLSVKVKIGDYETSTPLLTLSHVEDRTGDHWNRQVYHNMLNFSLFLVHQDGTANVPEITFTTAGSTDYSSSMGGSALQVAITAVQQLAPAAGVLTTLTAQASKDKAYAIDKALQSIFSNGITETHVSHRDLRKWKIGKGARLNLWIPNKEGGWDGNDLGAVGSWTVSFDYPRPSIFSDWSICNPEDAPKCENSRENALKNIHEEISYGHVLAYNLFKRGNSLGTIHAYLKQHDWFTSSIAALNVVAVGNKNVAEKMCQKIHETITDIGLNGYDADIVTWAVVKEYQLPVNSNDSPFTGEICHKAIDDINAINRKPSNSVDAKAKLSTTTAANLSTP